jgi:AcrR family transcriptional regulator/DNA-binding MarR family transcriptional regulator
MAVSTHTRDGAPARADVDRGGGRGGVAEIQRVRMIAALSEVARERGAGGVTVSHIVARSGVSRRTFYELFEDREDCFLAAFDLAVQHAARRVLPAYRVGGTWRERIRAGLAAVLEFLEDEPGMGALCIVEALGAGSVVLERRARVVSALIDAVDGGRGEARGSARPTRLTAEGVVGAVLAVLHARLAQSGPSAKGEAPAMAGLLGPLMGMIVLPYQGQATAARESARPAPRRRRAVHTEGDPLRDLDMRLTYRTVRVLLATAELSGRGAGPSNRQIADASGVQDQGQISKLLARLEHVGLICNNGAGPAKGEPNVWSLTAKGEEIERAIRRQATSRVAEGAV